MYWISRRIGGLTERINDFSRSALGGAERDESFRGGDELDALERRFRRLTDEVVTSQEIIAGEAAARARRQAELEQREKQVKCLRAVTDALGVGVLTPGEELMTLSTVQALHGNRETYAFGRVPIQVVEDYPFDVVGR